MQRLENEHWKSSEVARLFSLLESERRYYQDILAVLPVPLAVLDAEGRLAAVNSEFERRFPAWIENLHSACIGDLVDDAGLPKVLDQVLGDGQAREFIARVHDEHGETGQVRLSIQRINGFQNDFRNEILVTFLEHSQPEAQRYFAARERVRLLSEIRGLFRNRGVRPGRVGSRARNGVGSGSGKEA